MAAPKIDSILDALLDQVAFKDCFKTRWQGWLNPFEPPALPAMGVWYDGDTANEEAADIRVADELQRVALVDVMVIERVRADDRQVNRAVSRLIRLVLNTLACDPGLGGLIDKPIEFDSWDNFTFAGKGEGTICGSVIGLNVPYHVERGFF